MVRAEIPEGYAGEVSLSCRSLFRSVKYQLMAFIFEPAEIRVSPIAPGSKTAKVEIAGGAGGHG